jgi:acyl-CoA thioesterase-2
VAEHEKPVDFLGLLELERLTSRRFRGCCEPGARGRIFGGQLIAQALRVASGGVSDDRAPRSIQAHFLRPGRPALPVSYELIPLAVGRSFTTLRVDAVQEGLLFFTATVSFHVDEPVDELQFHSPRATRPEQLVSSRHVPPGSNPALRRPFDVRYADPTAGREIQSGPEQAVWIRCRQQLPDTTALHACTLAFASDLTLTHTGHLPLIGRSADRRGSSLDHSIWFHRSFRADDWLLFDQRSTGYAGSRAMLHGAIFDLEDRLVATVAQEALIRLLA